MSVDFEMQYTAAIEGSREELARIPEVMEKIVEKLIGSYSEQEEEGVDLDGEEEEDEYEEEDDDYYDDEALDEDDEGVLQFRAAQLSGLAQESLETDRERPFFVVSATEAGCDYPALKLCLDELDRAMPELNIAVYAIYVDLEYGEGSIGNILYSPAGSSNLKLDEYYGLYRRIDSLPDEDWIPYGWRHPKEKPPAARAEGTITLLGDWGGAERTTVEHALLDPDFLAAMGAMPMPGEVPSGIWQTEEGYRFSLGGKQNFGDLVEGLSTALNPYFTAHSASYAALCRTMREKKLLLHLYLDAYSGPNQAWSYGNHSAWHFLISSDGAGLLAQFTWCGTYSFGFGPSEGGAELLASYLYEALTGDALEELDEPVQHLMSQALAEYLEEHNPLDEPLENVSEDYFDMEEIAEDFAEEHEEELNELVRQVEESVVVRLPVRRFVPETFDSRFKGKRFVVAGELEGYTVEEVQALIQKFGGKVGKNVTATVNYLVYGSGVGNPFRTALKHNVTFLSADYFEDMTR